VHLFPVADNLSLAAVATVKEMFTRL
jgi:hypothetical protein